MANIQDTFFKELKAFLKNLIKVFPDDRDIKLMSSSINIAMMDDPENIIIKKFYNHLMPYEVMIDCRNPQFFYENKIHDENFQFFSKLHLYWENLHNDNRKIVWDYLQVLFLLSKSFINQMN